MKKTDEHDLGPIHPGEFLMEMLDELGITAYALAKAIGKAPIQVSRILSGKSSVTADMARLIAEALNTSPELWLNLQAIYDLERSRLRTPVLRVKAIVRNDEHAQN